MAINIEEEIAKLKQTQSELVISVKTQKDILDRLGQYFTEYMDKPFRDVGDDIKKIKDPVIRR